MAVVHAQNIAELNKYVTIQAPTKVSDGAGGFTTTWVAVASVWAAIWPISASERIHNAQLTGEISHRVRIRYRGGIYSSMRIRYGNKNYNITAPPIPAGGEKEWLDMLCKEAE